MVGLADVLDGTMDLTTFANKFRLTVQHSDLTAEEKTAVRADMAAFKKVLVTLDTERKTTPRNGLSAEEIKKGDVVSELRKNLFDASKSWMTETWSPDRVKTVGVKFIPGKVVWFNSNVSIPELGIKA